MKILDLWVVNTNEIVNVKLLPRPPRTVNTWPSPFGQFVYLLCRVNYDGALASAVGTFQATTITMANTMNIQSNPTEPSEPIVCPRECVCQIVCVRVCVRGRLSENITK